MAKKIQKYMVDILLCVFVLRPVIDLGWDVTIIAGLNPAGVVAVFVTALMILYVILDRKITFFGSVFLFAAYTTVVTLLNLSNPEEANNQLRLLSALAYLIVVGRNLNEKRLEQCWFLFVVFSIVPVILSYLQVIGVLEYTYLDFIGGAARGRATGGYHQPSVMNRFLIFGIIYSLYFLYRYKQNLRLYKKRFFQFYILISLPAVFFSYHRTTYILLTIILLLWMTMEYRGRFLKLLVSVAAAGIGVLGVFLFLYRAGLFSIDLSGFADMFSLQNFIEITENGVQINLRGRGGIIGKLMESFSANPWYYVIFGNGVDTNPLTGINMEVADMDFIRIAWNYGLAGIALWFNQLLFFVRTLVKSGKLINPYIHRAGIFIIFVYVVFGCTIEATNTPNFMYHVFLIIGYLYYQARNELECQHNMLIEGIYEETD